MIKAAPRTASAASLTPVMVRRRHPVRLAAANRAAARQLVIYSEKQARRRVMGEDLRFFVTCYLAGLAFFFIMLS